MRVYCTTGGARSELTVTGVIPAWDAADPPVRIALTDSPADADALEDSAKITVEPVVGKTIVIDATTKNLNETLSNPPPVPSPPTTSPSPSNTAPVALNSAQTAKAAIDVAMTVSALRCGWWRHADGQPPGDPGGLDRDDQRPVWGSS